MLEVIPEKYVFSVNAAARLILATVVQEENESAVDQWLDWESACLLVRISLSDVVFEFQFFD